MSNPCEIDCMGTVNIRPGDFLYDSTCPFLKNYEGILVVGLEDHHHSYLDINKASVL